MVPTYSEDETGVVSEGRKGGEDKTKKGVGLYYRLYVAAD